MTDSFAIVWFFYQVQQKQSESGDAGDTDSQYGTWETGLRTDDRYTHTHIPLQNTFANTGEPREEWAWLIGLPANPGGHVEE